MTITLTGTKGIDHPIIDIQINQDIYKSILVEETQTFNFKVNKSFRNLIKIGLTNKGPNDTILENGVIIADKTVKIQTLIVDEVRLTQPTLMMQGRVKTNDNQKHKHDGLYHNGIWSFYFENPAKPFFIKKKKFYYNTKLENTRKLLNKISHMFSDYVNH